MKSIYVVFTDAEFQRLLKAKSKLGKKQNWHHFIMQLAKGVRK